MTTTERVLMLLESLPTVALPSMPLSFATIVGDCSDCSVTNDSSIPDVAVAGNWTISAVDVVATVNKVIGVSDFEVLVAVVVATVVTIIVPAVVGAVVPVVTLDMGVSVTGESGKNLNLFCQTYDIRLSGV